MDKNNSYLGQLVTYIKKNLKKGYTKESLRWALVDQGHSRTEIEKSLRRAEEELAREAPILKTKPKITREIVNDNFDIKTVKIEEPPFWKRFFS